MRVTPAPEPPPPPRGQSQSLHPTSPPGELGSESGLGAPEGQPLKHFVGAGRP